MAKKDPFIQENTDKRGEEEQGNYSQSDGKNENDRFTQVKDASASGLGSIGRTDEKQPGEKKYDSEGF